MQHKILQKPDFGMIDIVFDQAGESVVTESGAMIGHDGSVEMTTNMRGGAFAALKRAAVGGESIFQNTYTATRSGERLQIAPATEGDIMHVSLEGPDYIYIQSAGYLACTEGVGLDTSWGGAKGFFSGAGLILLKADGPGDLWISSYGAIHAVEIGKPGSIGEHGYTVDTGHILAFTAGVDYKVRKMGGLKSFFLSGEGLVCEFSGMGTVYLMSRNPSSLAAFVRPFRPVQQNN